MHYKAPGCWPVLCNQRRQLRVNLSQVLGGDLQRCLCEAYQRVATRHIACFPELFLLHW